MPDELVKKIPPGFDRFDFFWSEYMLWSLRLVLYSANEYYFFTLRKGLMTFLDSWVISILILLYSILTLWFIETIFARQYNPAYEELHLSTRQRSYRIEGERLLYSGFLYSLINMAIGFATPLLLSPANKYIEYLMFESFATGLMGTIGSVFGVFFGVIFMVGRFGEPQRRIPLLYPLGLVGFMVPVFFVLYTLRHFFFRSNGGW